MSGALQARVLASPLMRGIYLCHLPLSRDQPQNDCMYGGLGGTYLDEIPFKNA